MTPPIAIIGAVITMVSIMISICCTCVVSLVVRVTSDAEPKRVELVDREVLDAREDRAAQDPAESGRHLRRVVAAGDRAAAWPTIDISSIRPPISRIAR